MSGLTDKELIALVGKRVSWRYTLFKWIVKNVEVTEHGACYVTVISDPGGLERTYTLATLPDLQVLP